MKKLLAMLLALLIVFSMAACGADASAKRLALLKKTNLPEHMSANAMLQALNLLYTLEELTTIVETLENEHG